MRVLWSSNAPWAGTGYGTQTKYATESLRRLGHQVGILAFYGLEGGVLNMGDTRIYPNRGDGYGNDVMGAHAQHMQADVVITLIDAWVMRPEQIPAPIAWCPWFPIDMEPIPPPVLAQVRHALMPLVYSRFAEEEARKANLDVRYVPHAVPMDVFTPSDRAAARRRLGWPAGSEDLYVFGMVAANKGVPSRKALAQHLEAFAHLARRHSDARLYLHTNVEEGGGLNLAELIDALGLRGKVTTPDPYGLTMLGLPESYMVDVYNAIDCLVSVSMGEGFGVPLLEAQACGTPVIVGDWTSMPELLFAGRKVPRERTRVPGYGLIAERDYTPLAAYQYAPRIGDILNAMESMYLAGKDAGMRETARAGALPYDVAVVTEAYWRPVLDEIAERLGVAEVAA